MGGWMLAALVPPCCSVAGGALRAQIGLAGPGVAWYALLLRPDGDRDGAGDSGFPHDGSGGSSSRVAPVLLLLSPRASLSILLASWW